MGIVIQGNDPKNRVPARVALGHDTSKPIVHHDDPVEFVKPNCGPGKAFPSFPTAEFMGCTVPPFVRSSPHGGITGEILRDLHAHLDKHVCNDLQLKTPGAAPVMLMDCRNSRLHPDVIECILDLDHLWGSTAGLSHAADLWQAGDSNAVNGNLKMETTKEKRAIMMLKRIFHLALTIGPTDIAPIVSKTVAVVFADPLKLLRALAARGLGPLTCTLLTDPDALAAKDTNLL